MEGKARWLILEADEPKGCQVAARPLIVSHTSPKREQMAKNDANNLTRRKQCEWRAPFKRWWWIGHGKASVASRQGSVTKVKILDSAIGVSIVQRDALRRERR